MGFVRTNIIPLLKEHRDRPCTGSLLCLGSPDVFFTFNSLQKIAHFLNVKLKETEIVLSEKSYFSSKNYISGKTLFQSIGFETISSLDYSDFEGAKYIFDLNNPLPESMHNQFDFIIDHGTIEHVFHVPNVFNNIYSMLKLGGRIMHSSPGSNYFDHGFYCYSPTLFYDFYSVNKWNINMMQVFQQHIDQENYPPFFSDYIPDLFSSMYGKLDHHMYGTICIAQKTKESTGTNIPQQGYYQNLPTWNQNQIKSDKDIHSNKIIGKITSLLKKI